jgi:hypothetical protein
MRQIMAGRSRKDAKHTMRNMTFFTTVIAILLCGGLLAQDVGADSVSYTPIPKTYGRKVRKEKTPKKMDTIFLNSMKTSSFKKNYFFSLQSGSLIGCASCLEGADVTSTLAVVNGITIGKKLRTGIGLGFDSYEGWKTIPVFASASWDWFGSKNQNAFFVQLNYGVAKAWRQKGYASYGYLRSEGDRMLSPQIGYRFKYHDLNLSLAVGAKLQRVFSFFEYPNWAWRDDRYVPTTTSSITKQDMNRFMVTVAVGWK